MRGIFYDPGAYRLHAVMTDPEPSWTLVTHNLNASAHHCRRIMREWLGADEMFRVDWNINRERMTA
jgi:hypothetical protein